LFWSQRLKDEVQLKKSIKGKRFKKFHQFPICKRWWREKMSEEGVYVHLYTQMWSGQESYVLGLVDGPSTTETPRGTLAELAEELMERAPEGFQGQIPINWAPPRHLVGKAPPKDIIPEGRRAEFAEALPEGVTVNLG